MRPSNLLTRFWSLASQLDPISTIHFLAAMLLLRGNIEESYSDVEFIVTNLCSLGTRSGKRVCTGADVERLLFLSRNIRREQMTDYEIDLKKPLGFLQMSFYVSRFNIRIKGYPHQMLEAAYDRFYPHNEWLKNHLGFYIEDCLAVARLFEKKYSEARISLFGGAEKDFIAKTVQVPPILRTTATINNPKSIKLPKPTLVDIAENVVTSSYEEITQSVNARKDRVKNVLSRLSKALGEFPRIDSQMDFNHLYKTPIVKSGVSYLVPLYQTFCQAISETFYYDVIEKDPGYLPEFESRKGQVSESRSYRYLAQAVPRDFIFPNVKYRDKDGEHEIADTIILFDDTLVIVQNKSKLLTLEAQKGNSDALLTDLQDSIVSACQQCVKAEELLLSGKLKTLSNDLRSEIPFEVAKIRKIYPVVTLEDRFPFVMLARLWPLINFKKLGYPFVVNLYDLAIVTSELSTPLDFLEYVEKRIRLNEKGVIGSFDELDLLGYYLHNRRSFRLVSKDGTKPPFTLLVNDWQALLMDRSLFLPKIMERDFAVALIDLVIDAVHKSYDSDALELITYLSRLRKLERALLGRKALAKSSLASKDGAPHYITLMPPSVDYGITVLFSSEPLEERKKRLVGVSLVAQYINRTRLWIGIASDPLTAKRISFIYVILDKEWEYDPQLEDMKKIYKPSELSSEPDY